MFTAHRVHAIVAVLLCPLMAQAQTQVLLLNQTLVDNEFLFGPGTFTRGQRVITANAGQRSVQGISPAETTLVCDDANVTDRFITVENFGSGTGSDEREALVANLTVDGAEPVPTYPWVDTAELALSARGATYDSDGIELDGDLARVSRVTVQNFRGIGVTSRLAQSYLDNLTVQKCHTGVKLGTSDVTVSDSIIRGMRDYGIWVADTVGNCYSSNNHVFGAEWAFFNGGGNNLRCVNDIYADARWGYFSVGGNASRVQLTSCFAQHISNTAMATGNGADHSFVNCSIDVMVSQLYTPTSTQFTAIGLELAGHSHTWTGGYINLRSYAYGGSYTNTAAKCGVLVNANDCKIDTRLGDWDDRNDTVGVRVESAITGGDFRFRTGGYDYSDGNGGFEHANERLIIVSNTGLVGTTWRFEGPGLDTTNIGKYLDIESGWSTTNSFTFVNTTTGATVTINNGAAY
jgi:hypothetical protein